ncbi:hypothetical protein GT037_006481 [Alternaria burnsii]|uniref:Uncharacterized protein n=1 Tax=Alternaria burnsii TaxID=1187904 RepID=A0A8H7EDI1_9PLEO|nr:uncharacterized protein GT037_006481 [Alternaria burnsii]KAF7675762.1 hypothetical protein GT037_006481 [Alternaria burnsii]
MMKLGQALDIDSNMPKLVSQLGGSREAVEQWCMIIEDYSQRAMAIESDKLPAIAALAGKFAPVLGEYYAGIWKDSFVSQLMWKRLGQLELGRRSDIYRAPSWSWASLDDGVSFRRPQTACCILLSAQSMPKNGHVPYGEVTRAAATLCGKISTGFITRADERGYCTLTLEKRHVEDAPLRRFYASYFHQVSAQGKLIEVSEAPMQSWIDDARHVCFPQCVGELSPWSHISIDQY